MLSQVIKRDGSSEPVSFDKVLLRLRNLCALPQDKEKLQTLAQGSRKYFVNANFAPLLNVQFEEIAKKVIGGIYPDVTTSQLDELAANIACPMSYTNPEYDTFAARALVSNYHKSGIYHLYDHFRYCLEHGLSTFTDEEAENLRTNGHDYVEDNMFYFVCKALYENVDEKGVRSPLISPAIFSIVRKDSKRIESQFNYSNDYNYKYLGFDVLRTSYLLKCNLLDKEGKKIWIPIERPQHMLMRVSMGIHFSEQYEDFDKMRTDNYTIWNAVSEDLRRFLSKKMFRTYDKQVKKNKIDWEQLETLLINHRNPYNRGETQNMLEKIKKERELHTMTWEQLLEKFDSKLVNELVVEGM